MGKSVSKHFDRYLLTVLLVVGTGSAVGWALAVLASTPAASVIP